MVLLLHDDELGEIGLLLKELRVDFVERTGHTTELDQRIDWALIIASQKRVSVFDDNTKMQKAQRIAIIENDSRTLRSMLRRLGVNFVVARPVHAAALRLLILHCLYRGPERRNQTRVSVGAMIQYRKGFFKHNAIMADLSLRGCRLLTEQDIKPGSKLKIIFPSDISSAKQFSLTGRVLRASRTSGSQPGQSVAVAFCGLTTLQGPRLRRVFEFYQNGPARLLGTTTDLVYNGGKPDQQAAATDGNSSERRTGLRKDYKRRVVTLNDEATRVLICRDISRGGMRVEPNESLVPGDELLVAIHAKARTEPIVVNVRVARDDGSDGLVLQFYDLSNECEAFLSEMVSGLPALGGEEETEANLIVSEIVERRAS